ncbi:MAG: peptide chain release factor N(5)-glutamine methyltransferase [Candidatus Berkelbacteria bacterium]|nr:peptide chain release factor N(5)-glutamine methyltransferase [Candidatus Berkelbacteria bacterium]
MKIRQALIWGAKELKKFESSALDAEVLLVFCMKKDKAWLFSHLDVDLSAKLIKKYKKLISRRKKEEPIAHITHHKEFFGLDFYVDKNVLIPRPATEILVENGLKFLESRIKNQELRILDLGTGAGAIAISIAKNIQIASYKLPVSIYATDISQQALKIAKKNAKKHRVSSKIKFIHSDLFDNLHEIKFDLIIANLPYLDSRWIFKELRFEPQKALYGGKNGLEIIEKFLREANYHLSQKGIILIEFDPRQKNEIKKLAKKYLPSKKISLIKDLTKFDRVMILR